MDHLTMSTKFRANIYLVLVNSLSVNINILYGMYYMRIFLPLCQQFAGDTGLIKNSTTFLYFIEVDNASMFPCITSADPLQL